MTMGPKQVHELDALLQWAVEADVRLDFHNDRHPTVPLRCLRATAVRDDQQRFGVQNTVGPFPTLALHDALLELRRYIEGVSG